jgi:Holliday junction resolvasome RuvABC DNA-binding subunit
MAEATITFRAEMSNLLKQLQEIPGVTKAEAKRMVAELKKQLAEAEKAAKDAQKGIGDSAKEMGAAGEKGADGMAELGKESGQAKEALSQLGSAVAVVNPELGSMVQQGSALVGSVKGVAGAFGVAGAALPVFAAAIAAAGFAWYAYSENERIAEQETRALGGSINGLSLALEDLEQVQEAGNDAIAAFREDVRKAALDIAVLTGAMTELERKQEDAFRAKALQIMPGLQAAAEAIKVADNAVADATQTLDEAQAKLDRVADGTARVSGGFRAIEVNAQDSGRAQREAAEEAVAAAKAQLGAAQRTADETRAHLAALKEERQEGQEVIRTALELEDAEKKAQTAARERTKANADAAREEKEELREQERQLAKVEAARQQMADIEERATMATLDAADQIRAKRDAELVQLRDLAVATGDRAAAAEAMAAVELEAEQKLAKVRAENLAAYQAAAEQAHREEMARLKEQTTAMVSSASQFFGSLASLAEWSAERQNEAQADAAERWFAFYKTATILQIGIDAAAAAIKAVAQLGPIAGGIAASVIGVTAGIQAAFVASQEMPSYHQGGMVLAPDERMAVLRSGEGVLTERGVAAVGGPGGLAAANRGAGAGQVLRIQQVYKHRVFGEFVRDNVRLPGSPLREAVKGGRRVGHRER